MDARRLQELRDQHALGVLRLRRSAERLRAAAEAEGRKRDAGKMATQIRHLEKDIAKYGIEAYGAARGLQLEPFNESLIEITPSGAAE